MHRFLLLLLIAPAACRVPSQPPAAPGEPLSGPGVARAASVPTEPALKLQEQIERAILPAVQVRGEEVYFTLAERMAEHDVLGLSIAVFDDYELVWAKGYGVADVETRQPVAESTLFQAASISKSVNALAVLMAVAEGKLQLDSPINELLRSWKLPENDLTRASPVNLRRLLSHTAGTTVHGFPGYPTGAPLPTLLQVLDGTPPANTPPVRVDLEPGSKFRYSGGGTSITQLVLVDTFGKPYPELLAERVLVPLGMTNSTYEEPLPPERLLRAAAGHRRDGTRVPTSRHVYPEMAAAGLWTTPTDLARFLREIALGRAGRSPRVSQAIATQMTTKVDEDGPTGMGVFLFERNGVELFGHGGDNEGFHANAQASLEHGRGLVIMSNSDNATRIFSELERTVFAALRWPGADTPVVPVPLSEAQRVDAWRQLLREAPASPLASEDMHTRYGHELLWDGKVAPALELFRAIVLVFPESPRAHESLGGAYEAAHETAAAVAAYETALLALKASPHVAPQIKPVVRARLEEKLIRLSAAR
jgi:CubicO group peptidase (beta-lactamase class C family)